MILVDNFVCISVIRVWGKGKEEEGGGEGGVLEKRTKTNRGRIGGPAYMYVCSVKKIA